MTNRYNMLLLAISLVAFNATLFCQATLKQLDIYILMGQSNMAGRGKITDSLKGVHTPKVLMLDSNGQWVQAHHPVHFDKPSISGVGPGLSFGIAMSENTSNTIALVPCAVGGTSIEKWLPGAYDQATNTHPYDDATKRITQAMKYGKVKGIIWHQGEANSAPAKAKDYINQLAELINRVRNFIGDTTLPFVAGELGYYKDEYQNINNVLKLLPEQVKFTGVVTAEGLVDKGDNVHFDAPSAHELGIRFAKKMRSLQDILR